jgi:hypothetical protein
VLQQRFSVDGALLRHLGEAQAMGRQISVSELAEAAGYTLSTTIGRLKSPELREALLAAGICLPVPAPSVGRTVLSIGEPPCAVPTRRGREGARVPKMPAD